MFRSLKLVLVKKPFATKKVLNLFSPSSQSVSERALTSTNYAVQKTNVNDEIQFSKLKEIEQLKSLEKHTFNTNSSQDVACRFILNENILVPNLIGYTKATVSFRRFHLKANISFSLYSSLSLRCIFCIEILLAFHFQSRDLLIEGLKDS